MSLMGTARMSSPSQVNLDRLLKRIRACRLCEKMLPHAPRPVLRASATASILLVGQAPGRRVHESGIPWNDPSGVELRRWLDVSPEVFYDQSRIAIVPTGFCYPGTVDGSDLPPRPECAPAWHALLLAQMPRIQLTLLIGQYAQAYYLRRDGAHPPSSTLTETVRRWKEFGDLAWPLPHPSPRNRLWRRKNPWFEAEVVPALRRRVRRILATTPSQTT